MFTIQSLDGKYVNLVPNVYAEKYKISSNNFQEIVNCVQRNINYSKENIRINDVINSIVFYEIERHWYNWLTRKIKFIYVVDMKNFTGKTLDLVIEKFEDAINDYIGRLYNSDNVEFTLIICIDEANDEFMDYINTDLLQEPNRIKLLVGVVLNDSVMYISTQKSIMFKSKYKKLKERMLKIFNLESISKGRT